MKKSNIVLLVLFMVLNLLGTPAVSFGLDVGDKASPFVGNSTKGEIQLANFLGKKKIVLALYFAAFTPV